MFTDTAVKLGINIIQLISSLTITALTLDLPCTRTGNWYYNGIINNIKYLVEIQEDINDTILLCLINGNSWCFGTCVTHLCELFFSVHPRVQ